MGIIRQARIFVADRWRTLPLPCLREDEDFVEPGEEDQYRPGTTHTACFVSDSCNNLGTCGFDVTVLDYGVALPTVGCEFFDFRDNQLLGGSVAGFVPVKLGDTSTLFQDVQFAGVELEADGSSLGPDANNAAFLSRQISGDFRAEMPVPTWLGGGASPKAGLMVRWGLSSDAPRAMAMHLPNQGDGTIEFRVRVEEGASGQALATSLPASGVTDLALEVEGQRVTVPYSIDHGQSWLIPGGALGGAASLTIFGDAQVGPALSSQESADTTFVFPYLEICPILGVGPGTPPPNNNEGCQDENFEDAAVAQDWTLNEYRPPLPARRAKPPQRCPADPKPEPSWTQPGSVGFPLEC